MIRAAIDGVGLAFMLEERAAPHIASGALVRVLEDWYPPFPGFFLYRPRQRQLPAALSRSSKPCASARQKHDPLMTSHGVA